MGPIRTRCEWCEVEFDSWDGARLCGRCEDVSESNRALSEALSGVRVVFWRCPGCPNTAVEWNHDCTVAECQSCGARSTDAE